MSKSYLNKLWWIKSWIQIDLLYCFCAFVYLFFCFVYII